MNSQGIKSGLGIARVAIAVIGLILCALIITSADSEMPVVEALEVQGGKLDGALWITYILILLGAAAALIYGVINVISNPKKNMGAVLGVVAMVLVFAITYYGFADDYVAPKHITTVSGTESMLAGAGLMTLYAVAVITIAAVVFAELSRLFK